MKTLKQTTYLVLIVLLLSACGAQPSFSLSLGGLSNLLHSSARSADRSAAPAAQPTATPNSPQASLPANAAGLLAAYEGVLENVYTQVSPSVVNIRVVQKQSAASALGQLPSDSSQDGSPQYSQGLGSGFVWDASGHIVTNNHVVDGADKIEVTFADGTTLPATLVGADAYSDLAVIKVDASADLLHPVQVADSTQVKVGELAIAIGNPFGLEGTMTVGIISALGRTLPASDGSTTGPAYSIPDVIQTDAPINPGNSGGVLVNDLGQVVGVTAAIESPVRANAGIGFAIPSAIVSKVVPALIEKGSYEHPYLGISGGNLTRDIAKAMGLTETQRGVLVATVVDGSPAAAAGLRPSQDTTTVDGQQLPIGGDVITAINGQAIVSMDDLIAYLNDQTEVGQQVKLTVQQSPSTNPKAAKGTWLGILGAQLTPEIATAMNLNGEQQGILVVQVEPNSPADEAGLLGSTKEATINGEKVMVGGDVITALDGKTIATLEQLRSLLRTYQPGAEVKLSLLRNGETLEKSVTLAERPSQLP